MLNAFIITLLSINGLFANNTLIFKQKTYSSSIEKIGFEIGNLTNHLKPIFIIGKEIANPKMDKNPE